MSDNVNILGCFVSNSVESEWTEGKKNFAFEQGKLFRTYLWGENGIDNAIKKLKHENYGKDMVMILFQYYLNPIPYLEQNLKEIEAYRKKEKAIGIPIIINHENFFSKPESERYRFLRDSIFAKLDLLETVVKKRKLDTDIIRLKEDLERVWPPA
jgi:hypothetical protein